MFIPTRVTATSTRVGNFGRCFRQMGGRSVAANGSIGGSSGSLLGRKMAILPGTDPRETLPLVSPG